MLTDLERVNGRRELRPFALWLRHTLESQGTPAPHAAIVVDRFVDRLLLDTEILVVMAEAARAETKEAPPS